MRDTCGQVLFAHVGSVAPGVSSPRCSRPSWSAIRAPGPASTTSRSPSRSTSTGQPPTAARRDRARPTHRVRGRALPSEPHPGTRRDGTTESPLNPGQDILRRAPSYTPNCEESTIHRAKRSQSPKTTPSPSVGWYVALGCDLALHGCSRWVLRYYDEQKLRCIDAPRRPSRARPQETFSSA